MIYWLTGQPGAGKTTLGNWLIAALQGDAVLVDGDDIREIFENKDYSEQGRRKNIEYCLPGLFFNFGSPST